MGQLGRCHKGVRALKKGDEVECQVVVQGGPRVNGGKVVAIGLDVAAVVIDMESKHCDIATTSTSDNGEPQLFLDVNQGAALHLTPGKEREITCVRLPDFKGWDLWCVEVSRYSLLACFVRSQR